MKRNMDKLQAKPEGYSCVTVMIMVFGWSKRTIFSDLWRPVGCWLCQTLPKTQPEAELQKGGLIFFGESKSLKSIERLKERGEKAMAAHSNTLAWKIPWTEEPGRLRSMGSLRAGHDWVTSLSLSLSRNGEGNGNPLQCSCLENPRDGEAWWAAIYGVA